ncbi:MAG: hypothetical protein ACE37F_08755 [Nannocystaceae bacterium]|nr:hypothetical protein [bacterium]
MNLSTLTIPLFAASLMAVGCNKQDKDTATPGDEFDQAGESFENGFEKTGDAIEASADEASSEIEDIDDDGDDQLGKDGNEKGDLEDIDNDGDDNL